MVEVAGWCIYEDIMHSQHTHNNCIQNCYLGKYSKRKTGLGKERGGAEKWGRSIKERTRLGIETVRNLRKVFRNRLLFRKQEIKMFLLN